MSKKIIFYIVLMLILNCSLIRAEDDGSLQNSTNIEESADEKKEVEIVISAAGDCSLGRDEKSPYIYSFDDEFIKQNKDYSYFFKNVKDIFEKDDLTIVNLEGPLTNEKNRADKKFSFKGTIEYVKILKEGSIEAANVANNHTFDYGNKGFSDTISNLKKEGIIYFGMDYRVLHNIKGINIGLLGYKAWSFDNYIKRKIKDDIKYLKSKGAAIIIVSFHWGDEGKYYPNKIQTSLAKYTIDSGADLIIGHHPHVIQGISEYKGKKIVYSLGNFCFGGNKNPKDKDAYIYQQTFKFSDGKLLDNNYEVIPVSISSVSYRNNYQPTPLKGSEAQRVLNRIKYYSNIK